MVILDIVNKVIKQSLQEPFKDMLFKVTIRMLILLLLLNNHLLCVSLLVLSKVIPVVSYLTLVITKLITVLLL
jgi:hypothetical protein